MVRAIIDQNDGSLYGLHCPPIQPSLCVFLSEGFMLYCGYFLRILESRFVSQSANTPYNLSLHTNSWSNRLVQAAVLHYIILVFLFLRSLRLCRNEVCWDVNRHVAGLWSLTLRRAFMFIGGHVNTDLNFSSSLPQMDCSLKPSQRTDMLGRRNKGKRGPEENGGGPLSEPEEGAPHSYSSSCLHKSKNKRRRIEVNHWVYDSTVLLCFGWTYLQLVTSDMEL